MNSPVAVLNRLRNANSPYLLGHADNPVDWYPWGEEALTRAKHEDKPILLSVGYAACHWCHVMEHESFRDELTASLMNEHFVCIKVDREERADVDEVYMTATLALTGQGGWPMTVFLTPNCDAFYAGTYFPPEDSFGRPGFKSVLRTIADVWQKNRARVVDESVRVTEQLRALIAPAAPQSVSVSLVNGVVVQLRASFDVQFGGFGEAPKFPPHAPLRLLADCYLRDGTVNCLDMHASTLKHIRNGGIHDHLGGGFSRYSTDNFWHVPHFEKMLYDNAQLAASFLFAYQETKDEIFCASLQALFDWVQTEMTSPDGGFYTSLDADSDGEEGRFYTFSWDEVHAALDANETELACRHFDIRPEGNWEGTNVLWEPGSVRQLAEELGLTETAFASRLATIKAKLLEARAVRSRPLTDDKILAGHTGLMLGAFAQAGRVLGNSRYVQVAIRAAQFVSEKMLASDGRLHRVYRRGQCGVPAMLEDYAYLAEGLVQLYEATGIAAHLRLAETLAVRLLEDFYDAEHGRLYHSPDTHEGLPFRATESHDGATPNATAIAVMVLARLSVLLARPQWRSQALGIVAAHGRAITRSPRGHCDLLRAARLCQEPLTSVVLVPGTDSAESEALWTSLGAGLDSSILWIHLPKDAGPLEVGLPLFSGRISGASRPSIYLCRGETCSLPVHTKDDFHQLLSTMR